MTTPAETWLASFRAADRDGRRAMVQAFAAAVAEELDRFGQILRGVAVDAGDEELLEDLVAFGACAFVPPGAARADLVGEGLAMLAALADTQGNVGLPSAIAESAHAREVLRRIIARVQASDDSPGSHPFAKIAP